ncbi:MAG TPA: hypothetical protein VFK14_05920 [Solirubrobacterales bacterium]|nr:hypothetical protein [Solirubrobacterales bacterium]
MNFAISSGKKLVAYAGLALAAALAALALTAAAPASAAGCPAFKVLHNDRIGPATLPAGSYEVVVEPGLSCQIASQLFARFLEDYDGVLPKPWRVVAEGTGKASFTRGSLPSFSVSRIGGGENEGSGGDNILGRLCSGTFTVNAGSRVGPLVFPKGQYLLYLPPRSGITCRRASVLFTRFLAAPDGTLPYPWRLKNQTATFYKPAHPTRSAFRIEPLNGT